MLHVVLDANCVGLRAPLAGNPQVALLDAARSGQLTLVVPELVVREVANKWREGTLAEVEKLRKPASE